MKFFPCSLLLLLFTFYFGQVVVGYLHLRSFRGIGDVKAAGGVAIRRSFRGT
jgi:hypothetical protein